MDWSGERTIFPSNPSQYKDWTGLFCFQTIPNVVGYLGTPSCKAEQKECFHNECLGPILDGVLHHEFIPQI
jgi:hypothetical protein